MTDQPEVYVVHHHDIEKRAEHFNEGYDEAQRQGIGGAESRGWLTEKVYPLLKDHVDPENVHHLVEHVADALLSEADLSDDGCTGAGRGTGSTHTCPACGTKPAKASVCTCRTVALSGWDTVQQVLDPRCPIHPEPTFTASEVKELTTTATAVALALGRKEAAEDLRYLSLARKDYCARCPEHQGDMHEMGPMALAIHEEHASAVWLADILEGANDAKGWLPSWRWEEWVARGSQAASERLGADSAPLGASEESVPAESAFPRGCDCYKLPRAADGVLRHHANCVTQPAPPEDPHGVVDLVGALRSAVDAARKRRLPTYLRGVTSEHPDHEQRLNSDP